MSIMTKINEIYRLNMKETLYLRCNEKLVFSIKGIKQAKSRKTVINS